MATGTQLEKSAPVPPGTVPLAAGVGAIWTRGRVQWAGMQPKQRAWAMVAAALLVGMAAFLLWNALRTDWRILYADLDPEDARQIGQTLTQAQIPFDVAANGVLRVPAPQLDKARLATAAKGGVKSGRLGFELFDKPNWVGSEFDAQVNYQRALEEKLIATLEPVTGVGNVRASVTLDYDDASTEQTEETYDPDQSATLQMQRTEQSAGNQPVAAGIPGT